MKIKNRPKIIKNIKKCIIQLGQPYLQPKPGVITNKD